MPPLSADRVIEAAVEVADDIGIDAFTIRRLATALDVKPMTIYHHVANKEAIIDGMVDAVFAEIELPTTDEDWRTGMRLRAVSAREVLARHPWATPLLDSRANPGPATLRHHNTVLGCLSGAGFSFEMAGHTMALLDAFVYGFALQEAALPATSGDHMDELADDVMSQLDPEAYPHFVAFVEKRVLAGDYDFADEFTFGLDLILDALEQRL
jgi:AcrR family transcriptional regulator